MRDRRTVLVGLAAGAAATALPGIARGELPATRPTPEPEPVPSCGISPALFPDVVVETHDGRRARFYEDLIRGRTVMIHFTSVESEAAYPVLGNLAQVQPLLGELLGDRLGSDVFLYSITIDPERDTPRVLRQLAARHDAGPGWLFLTGEPAAIGLLRARLFAHDGAGRADRPVEDSRGLLRYGNAALGLWGSVPAKADPQWLATRLAWVQARQPAAVNPAGPPPRRGPIPLSEQPWGRRGAVVSAGKLAGLLLALALAASALAETQSPAQPQPQEPPDPQKRTGHPYPQPPLACSAQTTSGDTTTVATGESLFPPSRPFLDPPGTNLLPTIYTNLFDSNGDEIPNTLPSTPAKPYNLHDGDPVVSPINPTSPTDDLQTIFTSVPRLLGRDASDRFDEGSVRKLLQLGVDVLEGNPVPNRAYSGFALLHYTGPEELKTVEPIYDVSNKVVGGNVDIHQVWYDGHIEADIDMVDPTAVLNVPWTITYTVDVLNRGEDDFSPYAIYVDVPPATPPPPCPPAPPACQPPLPPAKPPLAAMDQTFFPMADGTRTVFKIKMAPGKYLNMIYVWGWRMHPPRIQVIENATKKVNCTPLHELEVDVFGPAPRSSEQAKLAAIAKIGDISPAKRMWQAFRDARAAAERGDWKRVLGLVGGARDAFGDWRERTQLPSGVTPDRAADITLLYVNNTIYGELTAGTLTRWPQWQTRGAELKVTLYNGDFFDHGYMDVDFGGGRGWENQFKSSVKWGGSGCWFTFGRGYWWPNLPAMVTVPAASQNPYKLGLHKARITYNFDPSRRLRFYQLDPNHDVAIFSVH